MRHLVDAPTPFRAGLHGMQYGTMMMIVLADQHGRRQAFSIRGPGSYRPSKEILVILEGNPSNLSSRPILKDLIAAPGQPKAPSSVDDS